MTHSDTMSVVEEETRASPTEKGDARIRKTRAARGWSAPRTRDGVRRRVAMPDVASNVGCAKPVDVRCILAWAHT